MTYPPKSSEHDPSCGSIHAPPPFSAIAGREFLGLAHRELRMIGRGLQIFWCLVAGEAPHSTTPHPWGDKMRSNDQGFDSGVAPWGWEYSRIIVSTQWAVTPGGTCGSRWFSFMPDIPTWQVCVCCVSFHWHIHPWNPWKRGYYI